MNTLNVERLIHQGWYENEAMKSVGVEPIFEKYQYIYSLRDVKISLVQFTPRMYAPNNWEIYQIHGDTNLFEDVERFKSKEDAEKRIKELLGGMENDP